MTRGKQTRLTLGRLSFMVLCSVLLAGQSQPPEIEQARRAYLEGRFEDAIEQLEPLLSRFKEDISLRETAFLLGLSHLALRQEKEGLSYFGSAVRHDPGFVPSAGRYSPDVVKAYEKVRAGLVGELTVETAPPGARVLLGGREIGETPYRGAALAADHIVRLMREGYRTEERPVRVTAGETTAVTVSMQPLTAAVTRKPETPTEEKGGSNLPWVLVGAGGAGAAAAIALGGNKETSTVPPTATTTTTSTTTSTSTTTTTSVEPAQTVEVILSINEQRGEGPYACSGAISLGIDVANKTRQTIEVRRFEPLMVSLSASCSTFTPSVDGTAFGNGTIGAGTSARIRQFDIAGELCRAPGHTPGCRWRAEVTVQTTFGSSQGSIVFSTR